MHSRNTPPTTNDLLDVFAVISGLANVYRHNVMAFDTQRNENVAEHSYALATLGCALAQEFNKSLTIPLDVGMIAQFSLVHDASEVFMEDGDISVYAPSDLLASKKDAETKAFTQLQTSTQSLPWLAEMVSHYEEQSSAEANFVYALDKIIVHMIVILADHHHAHPTFNRYLETERVARHKISQSFPQLLPYFEELCQIFKDSPQFFDGGLPSDSQSSRSS